MTLATLLLLLFALHLAVTTPLTIRLLLHRIEPSTMLVWLLVLLFVPLIGPLLYARLGENQVLLRAQRKRGAHDCQFEAPDDQEATVPVPEGHQSTAQVGIRLAGATVTAGNHVELFDDSNAIHESWKEAIEQAERSIHMEYFIWYPDDTGTEMRDLVVRRAGEGITCRILLDAVGSISVGSNFLAPFYEAQVQVAFFLPLASWKRRWSPHLRNHRKILVVDGQVGFVGSQNVSDDDRGRNPQYSPWHNVHLRLEGPCVRHIEAVFLDDWHFASDTSVPDAPARTTVAHNKGSLVQILATGPDCEKHTPERMLLEAFYSARHTIDIVTPYFVPSPVLRMGLLQAALRGVRIRIVIPSNSDQLLALYAGRSYYAELVNEGIEIYEYGTGMLHSKMIVVDQSWAMAGSTNLDYRSLRLNYEISALLYSEAIANTMTRIVERYCATATPILAEDIATTSRRKRLFEGAARVLSSQL